MLPDLSQFAELARQGNFVPVYREWVADLDTPVSAWLRTCRGQRHSFLLESVEGGENIGRYSLLGYDPLWVLEARGDRAVQTFRDGSVVEHRGNPFEILNGCLESVKPVKLPQLPPGIGGLFGIWGYELIQWIEPRVPIHAATEDDLPDGLWMQVDRLMIFDQVKRKVFVVAYADLRDPAVDLAAAYGLACDRVNELIDRLQSSIDRDQLLLRWTPPGQPDRPALTPTSNTTREAFHQNVLAAKEHIKAGDIFQVVISQRLSTSFTGDPFDIYRSLRLVNPSPYMAYFQFGDWQLIGSSPEIMVKTDRQADGTVQATLRPIAGTRPRGATTAEDLAYEQDLLADPKEIAEHVMLVDLGRNDLGRVCSSGTVTIDRLMTIERYSHVMHIVSNAIGQVAGDRSAWDVLAATFPAGTVSGAPKIRAMEIIHKLEGCRRGPYSGAYGYYDFEGQLNTAITLRTAIVRDQPDGSHRVSVQAGAGLVADSDPEKEYQETLNKARGVLEALRCLEPAQP
jgi:anthranilate synthase component 1